MKVDFLLDTMLKKNARRKNWDELKKDMCLKSFKKRAKRLI